MMRLVFTSVVACLAIVACNIMSTGYTGIAFGGCLLFGLMAFLVEIWSS